MGTDIHEAAKRAYGVVANFVVKVGKRVVGAVIQHADGRFDAWGLAGKIRVYDTAQAAKNAVRYAQINEPIHLSASRNKRFDDLADAPDAACVNTGSITCQT
jgi:hypothetical protein